MKKREIEEGMKNLLKKLLDEKEFKLLTTIVENRGNSDFQGEE